MTSAIERLPAHLEKRYGISVKGLKPLEPWAPEGVQRVDRHDGPAWVARVFGPTRPVECVEGDAEILRFLEEHDFPAERWAHAEPVSTFGEHSVLVTKLVPGRNCRGDNAPETVNGVARLLGRLHALPEAPGAVSRAAGGWHHLSERGGGRREDVAILLPKMDEVAERLAATQIDDYKAVRAAVENIDDCEDLPKALINVDFGGPNIMKSGKKLAVVDWTGSGRGPRVLSMPALLSGWRNLALVDAFVAGYREHAQLTDVEIDRLPTALPVFSIVLDCWSFIVGRSTPADLLRSFEHTRQAAARVAARAREAFDADPKVLARWKAAPVDAPEPAQAQDPLQILINAVNAKSDDEIAAFAAGVGGYPALCHMVFQGIRARRKPADCTVGFVLGDDMGWVLRSSRGKIALARRIPKRAPAIVHASPPDFLRLITRDLDWDRAITEGRVKIEGDPVHVQTLFA